MTDFLPCPFCGGAAWLSRVEYATGPSFFCACVEEDCVEGPERKSQAEAIAAWNQRPREAPTFQAEEMSE